MKLRRMLAVTDETTLTGAPMNLLHLLTWMRKNTSIEVHLVALQDGPLRHRFEEVCEVTVLDRSFVSGLLGVAQQGLIHLGSSRAWKSVAEARLRPQLRHLSGYDLIYSNSIASSGILPYLPHRRGRKPCPRATGRPADLEVARVPRCARPFGRVGRRFRGGAQPPGHRAGLPRGSRDAALRVH